MRKYIVILIVMVLLLSFAACSKQVEEVKVNSTPDTTDEPPMQQTQEVSESTPTPKPTLSEEERRVIAKYNELIGYCENYKDWSAAVSVRDMYDSEEISETDFYQLALIPGFEETRDLSDEVWGQVKDHVKSLSLIINGQLDVLDEAGMEKFYQSLSDASQKGLYISILLTLNKRRTE